MKKNKKGQIIIRTYKRITLSELQPFDILLYYGKNWFTTQHGKHWQRNKYGRTTKCPYHINIIYDIGKTWNKHFLMDTEVKNTGSILETEYLTQKKLRIDIIRIKNLSNQDKKNLAKHLEHELGREAWYGVMRFVSFAKRVKYIGWMFKWIKPSKKQVVCSGRVAMGPEKINKPISDYPYNETIPNDSLVYALRHPRKCSLYTLKLEGE